MEPPITFRSLSFFLSFRFHQPTLLQMLGLKLKLHEFLPMLAPMLCM
jgi:hypothetical protein